MQLGIVGLGRMGGNMAERILRDSDHDVVVFDHDPAAIDRLEGLGAVGIYSLDQLVTALDGRRAIWVMVPAGESTKQVIDALAEQLSPGDIVIDGGNSRWSDTVARFGALQDLGIHLVDVGTSGGIHGLTNGYCMMVGGETEPIKWITPILDVLAPASDVQRGPGWLHVGDSGAGHYVKMVHNGIEYGMMRALAEGLGIMSASEFELDLGAISQLWTRGSVVRSWLVELLAKALDEEGDELNSLRPVVSDSGEGRWTVDEAVRLRVPAPVIAASLFSRFASQGHDDFAGKVTAALRAQFGGHAVTRTS